MIPVGNRSIPRTAFNSEVLPRLNRPTRTRLKRSSASRVNSAVAWSRHRCLSGAASSIWRRRSAIAKFVLFVFAQIHSNSRRRQGTCSRRDRQTYRADVSNPTTIRPPAVKTLAASSLLDANR